MKQYIILITLLNNDQMDSISEVCTSNIEWPVHYNTDEGQI